MDSPGARRARRLVPGSEVRWSDGRDGCRGAARKGRCYLPRVLARTPTGQMWAEIVKLTREQRRAERHGWSYQGSAGGEGCFEVAGSRADRPRERPTLAK